MAVGSIELVCGLDAWRDGDEGTRKVEIDFVSFLPWDWRGSERYLYKFYKFYLMRVVREFV